MDNCAENFRIHSPQMDGRPEYFAPRWARMVTTSQKFNKMAKQAKGVDKMTKVGKKCQPNHQKSLQERSKKVFQPVNGQIFVWTNLRPSYFLKNCFVCLL